MSIGFGVFSVCDIKKLQRPGVGQKETNHQTALDVVLTAAFSDKTDRSMVIPRHEIRLHLLLNKHIRHPEQAAEHKPKTSK